MSPLHAPIVLDVAGTRLQDDDRRRLQHPLVGGLILFGRNWESRAQLTDMCCEIKAIRPDVLIAVDHEGGRVQRFRTDGFTHLPPMAAFGECWMSDGKHPQGHGAMVAMQAAAAAGLVLASELRACGIDLSFAPVLDLDHGSSGVIGSRAFHRDPKVVTVLAQSVIMGMRQADMQACGKHFPGHGFVKADSHLAVAVDKRSLRALRADDLQPFQWLSGQLGALMPAHVIYPKVDDQPAGFSRKWLQDILRDELGFTGAVFSDDLSMEGARAGGSAVQGAVKALQAGCDLVLFCNQSLGDGRALDGFMDGLGEALARGEWVGSEDSEARRLDLLPQRAPKVWDDLMHDAAYQVALERLAQV